MVNRPIGNFVKYCQKEKVSFTKDGTQKLVQSMFIFLFINTKHGYSSENNCSYVKKKLELYRETVEKCQDQVVYLRNFYDKNYSQVIPIFLPEYRQFKIKTDYSDSNKVETLLQYNVILLTYHSAFVDFRKENQKFGLPIIIKNIINNLDKIINCFKPDRQPFKSRFNKTEIKKKNKGQYEVKTIYAIIVQFLNFLSNVMRILS